MDSTNHDQDAGNLTRTGRLSSFLTLDSAGSHRSPTWVIYPCGQYLPLPSPRIGRRPVLSQYIYNQTFKSHQNRNWDGRRHGRGQ